MGIFTPLHKLKNIWEYSTYNKPFFFLILVLLCVWNYLQIYADSRNWVINLFVFMTNIVLTGYGLTIARDIINKGIRLPKIMIKDICVLGIKGTIVYTIYLSAQALILSAVSLPLNFPEFDLEELLIDISDTFNLFFSHSPVDTLIFIIVGGFLFYFTTFFMEIALARLADTGSLKSAFNLVDIKNDIDLMGWRNYTKDYTFIILSVVFITFLSVISLQNVFLNYVWYGLLMLLVFIIQYWGIGIVYAQIKEKKLQGI